MEKIQKIEIKKGSAKFIRAYDTAEQIYQWRDENPEAIGLAFVGRSNVGKSSLINTLFGGKTARTSKTPGRTQKINIFTFELTKDSTYKKYYLFDLPGYGHAEVNKAMSKNWTIIMDAFFQSLNGRTLLLNLQDARHPDQQMDKQFYEYINPTLIEIFLVLNKMDKLKRQKERAALNKLKPQIYASYKHVKQIFFVSAEKKDGVDPLELAIISYLQKISDADSLTQKLQGLD
jgi:GTP-binding protein